jgi:predicted dehydrogenase
MSSLSRRSVMKHALAGAAGAVLASSARSAKAAVGANERLRIAVLGPGDRAQHLMHQVIDAHEKYNAEIVGVCDLWPRRREDAAGMLKLRAGWDVGQYANKDELYAAKDIDALIIATPDFSHALLCAEAVRNGKDVYVEKPLADVIEDAKVVRDAVKKSGQIVQVGTQRRSDGVYQGAAEYIQSGQFGPVVAVEMHWCVNQSKRWRREGAVKRLTEDIDAGKFDVDTAWKYFRLNRGKDDEFEPRKYVEFRLFWPYSAGLPDQWMSHQIDTVAMLTGDPYPKSCVAGGGIYMWKDGRRNCDTFTAVFEYPSGFQVRWHGRQTNGSGGVNEVYYSNWGELNMGTGRITGAGAPDDDKSPGSKALDDIPIPRVKGMDHMQNWLEAVRARTQPSANIDAGYAHSVALSMAIQALHTGKRVAFDPIKQEIEVA